MTQDQVNESLAEDVRKEIFRTIVEAQDQEMDVAQSRKMAAERFGVTAGQVLRIEREGMDNEWPPL